MPCISGVDLAYFSKSDNSGSNNWLKAKAVMPSICSDQITPEAVDRFFNKVSFGTPNDCWEWVGAQKPSGYGNLRYKNTYYLAHRFAYAIFEGDLPDDKYVCHHCDHPPCVNSSHLFLGTAKENTRDMMKKGRDGFQKNCATGKDSGQHTHPEKRMYGEKNGNALLDWDTVDEMRQRYENEDLTYDDLAEEYGVSISTISLVIRKERWIRKDIYQMDK